MKPLLCILFSCLLWGGLSAQSDTTFISTHSENGDMEKTAVQDRYAELFGAMQPMRWTLKWNLVNNSRFDLLNIGGEFKLNPSWSLNLNYDGQIGLQTYNTLIGDISNTVFSEHVLRVEPRYYFDMARQIRAGKSADNLSGNYFSAEGSLSYTQNDNEVFSSGRSLGLRFGMQRRFLRRLYFDLSAGAGWQSSRIAAGAIGAPWQNRVYLAPRFTGGLLFGNIPPKVNGNTTCSVLRCFEEENHLLKVDVLGAVSLYLPFAAQTGLGVEYEHKLGWSPFSLALGAGGTYTGFSSRLGAVQEGGLWNAQLELRYYNTLKKRIARGKSGNNLNGTYFALNSGYTWRDYKLTSSFQSPETQRLQSGRQYAGLNFGVQQRVFKHGFIDLSVGTNFGKSEQHNLTLDQKYSNGWEFGIGGRIRAGFAF